MSYRVCAIKFKKLSSSRFDGHFLSLSGRSDDTRKVCKYARKLFELHTLMWSKTLVSWQHQSQTKLYTLCTKKSGPPTDGDNFVKAWYFLYSLVLTVVFININHTNSATVAAAAVAAKVAATVAATIVETIAATLHNSCSNRCSVGCSNSFSNDRRNDCSNSYCNCCRNCCCNRCINHCCINHINLFGQETATATLWQTYCARYNNKQYTLIREMNYKLYL